MKQKKAEIKDKGTQLIKKKITENSKAIDRWVKLNLYSIQDDPPKNNDDLAFDFISQLDFTVERKSYQGHDLQIILDMAQKFIEKQKYIRSACNPAPVKDEVDDLTTLAPIYPKYPLKCEFIKNVNTPVVVYEFRCNLLKEIPKRKMKAKKDPVHRGQGQSGKRRPPTGRGPLAGGKGPSLFFDYQDEFANINSYTPPLNAEDKDPSQFSIEFDKSGNLVGFNFQLSEDGSTLKDPDSVDSGVDSRWSWNALASPKKGFMNKLLLK